MGSQQNHKTNTPHQAENIKGEHNGCSIIEASISSKHVSLISDHNYDNFMS